MPDEVAAVFKREAVEKEEEGKSRYREYRGVMGWLAKFIGASLCLFILLYMSGMLHYGGFYLVEYQFNSIFLGGMLALAFLVAPARKGLRRNKLPWYDVVLILASIAVAVYPFVNA